MKQDTETLSDKPNKVDMVLFFFLYPLYDQNIEFGKKLSILYWAIQSLQFLGIAFFGVNLNGTTLVSKIAGFVEGSYLASITKLGFLIFNLASIFIFILATLSFVAISFTYKKIITTSPWIIDLYRSLFRFYISILHIPLMSILLSSFSCTGGETSVLIVNNNIQCKSALRLAFLIIGIIISVLIAVEQFIYRLFIFKNLPKHGGLNSHFNSEIDALIFAVYISMQIAVMRTTITDRGWRSMLTMIPTIAIILELTFQLPYYHRIKNIWWACVLMLYLWIRIIGEIQYFLKPAKVGHIILWVILLLAGIGCCIGLIPLIIWRSNKLLIIRNTSKGEFIIPVIVQQLNRSDSLVSFDRIPTATSYVSQRQQQQILRNNNDVELRGAMKNESTLNEEGVAGQTVQYPVVDVEYAMYDRTQNLSIFEPSMRFLSMKKEWRDQYHMSYADICYRFALSLYPDSAWLIGLYSLFLHTFKRQHQKGDEFLRQIRNANPNIIHRFLVYAHFEQLSEDANMNRSRDDSKSKSKDASNMQAQDDAAEGLANDGITLNTQAAKNALEQAQNFHITARKGVKEFWQNILRNNVDYASIPLLLQRVVDNEHNARRQYEELLITHPNNPQVLRWYGALQRDIYRDEDTAEIYLTRADQIEEELNESNPQGASQTGSRQGSRHSSSHPPSDNGSRSSDNSSIAKKRKKKKKKKGGVVIEEMNEGGGSMNGASDKSRITFFIPTISIIFFLSIVAVIAGYFIIQYQLGNAIKSAEYVVKLNDLTADLGRLALFSKYSLMSFHYLYQCYSPPSPIPDDEVEYYDVCQNIYPDVVKEEIPEYFPDYEQSKEQLQIIGDSLIQNLQDVYLFGFFDPWEVQDCEMMRVLYLDGQVDKNYLQIQSIFDVMREFAYQARSLALVEMDTDTQFRRLSEVIINFPTTVMESVKRALRSYVSEIESRISFTQIVILIQGIGISFILTIIFVVCVIYAFVATNKDRRQALQLLLVVPKQSIHQITLDLAQSEQEMDEITAANDAAEAEEQIKVIDQSNQQSNQTKDETLTRPQSRWGQVSSYISQPNMKGLLGINQQNDNLNASNENITDKDNQNQDNEDMAKDSDSNRFRPDYDQALTNQQNEEQKNNNENIISYSEKKPLILIKQPIIMSGGYEIDRSQASGYSDGVDNKEGNQGKSIEGPVIRLPPIKVHSLNEDSSPQQQVKSPSIQIAGKSPSNQLPLLQQSISPQILSQTNTNQDVEQSISTKNEQQQNEITYSLTSTIFKIHPPILMNVGESSMPPTLRALLVTQNLPFPIAQDPSLQRHWIDTNSNGQEIIRNGQFELVDEYAEQARQQQLQQEMQEERRREEEQVREREKDMEKIHMREKEIEQERENNRQIEKQMEQDRINGGNIFVDGYDTQQPESERQSVSSKSKKSELWDEQERQEQLMKQLLLEREEDNGNGDGNDWGQQEQQLSDLKKGDNDNESMRVKDWDWNEFQSQGSESNRNYKITPRKDQQMLLGDITSKSNQNSAKQPRQKQNNAGQGVMQLDANGEMSFAGNNSTMTSLTPEQMDNKYLNPESVNLSERQKYGSSNENINQRSLLDFNFGDQKLNIEQVGEILHASDVDVSEIQKSTQFTFHFPGLNDGIQLYETQEQNIKQSPTQVTDQRTDDQNEKQNDNDNSSLQQMGGQQFNNDSDSNVAIQEKSDSLNNIDQIEIPGQTSDEEEDNNKNIKKLPPKSVSPLKVQETNVDGKEKDQMDDLQKFGAFSTRMLALKQNIQTDDEEENDDRMRGIVRNIVVDTQWEEEMDTAIQKTQSAFKQLPGAMNKTHIIHILAVSFLFFVASILPAIILLIYLRDIDNRSSSVMLAGFEEQQFMQVVLFTLQMIANKGEMAWPDLDETKLNEKTTSSPFAKNFSYLGTDVEQLQKLVASSFDYEKLVQETLYKGTDQKTGWIDDYKLDIPTIEADVEVRRIMFTDGDYQCPLDEQQCVPDRIQGVNMYVGFDLLSARFQRKLMFLTTSIKNNDLHNMSLDDENLAFIQTAARWDLAAQYDKYTNSFLTSMQDAKKRFAMICLIAMILQLAIFVAIFLYSVIVLYMMLGTICSTTQRLRALIPESSQLDQSMDDEIRTHVPQIDVGNKKIIELQGLITEAVQNFSSRGEVHALCYEMLQLLRSEYQLEDKMMTESNYGGDWKERHIREHIAIQQRMTIISENFSENDDSTVFGSLILFEKLFDKHFKEQDKLFGMYYTKTTGMSGDDEEEEDEQDDLDEAAAF